MRNTVRLLVLLTLVSPAWAQPKQRDAMVAEDLARLERKVALDPARMPSTQPLDQQRQAAVDFATKVAGANEAKFVRAFRTAFNAAVNTQATVSPHGMRMMSIEDDAPITPNSIWNDALFLKNAAALIRDPNRIVGGTVDKDNEFADCVAIGGDASWCCTGTLIASNVVLTAGHCYPDCTKRVFVGLNVNASGEIIKVKSAVRHPNYGVNGQHNDLTVLILESDVSSVKPRAIADSTAIDGATTARLAGFGNTDVGSTQGYGIRRKVDVPVATTNCEVTGSHERYGCDPGLEMVAGQPFLNRDSCNGDSGGPLLIQVNGKWLLAAATSRATSESLRPCGDGGVYVRVDKYAEWIRQVPGGHWQQN